MPLPKVNFEARVDVPSPPQDSPRPPSALWQRARRLGVALVTGAADDDPAAIGAFASAGARFGLGLLWTVPLLLPLMASVVYLSAKIGRVTGAGLMTAIQRHYSRGVVRALMVAIVAGNLVEAAADLGGVGAALHLFVPLRGVALVVPVTLAIVGLQFFGGYRHLRDVFRALALVLLVYIAAALLAHPHWGAVLRATVVPAPRFHRDYLLLLLALCGTALSPYLMVWQAAQEVEEHVAGGEGRRPERFLNAARLRASGWDALTGMGFAALVSYFILLASAAGLHDHGSQALPTAAQAAAALRPAVGHAASLLFALGVVAVGLLAVPVMTVGAAWALCETVGWRHGLHARPHEARGFYITIGVLTCAAAALNLIGWDPMKFLIAAGVIQGLLAPVLIYILLRLTSAPKLMGRWTNRRGTRLVAGAAVALTAIAAAAMLISLAW